MFPQKRGYSTVIGYFEPICAKQYDSKKLRYKITHKKIPAFLGFNVRHFSFIKYYIILSVLSRFFDF